MNRLLANPLDKERVKGKLFVFLSLLCLLPVLLNTLIIVPIYASLESNVLYHGSLVSVLIKYLQDFFDLCAVLPCNKPACAEELHEQPHIVPCKEEHERECHEISQCPPEACKYPQEYYR